MQNTTMKSQKRERTAKVTKKIEIRRNSGNNQQPVPITRQQFLPSARQYQRDQRVSKNFHDSLFSAQLTQEIHRVAIHHIQIQRVYCECNSAISNEPA